MALTDHYLVDLIDPDSTPVQRAARYCVHKQPVFPHLANPEASGLEPDELRARLEAELGSLPGGGCVGSAQAEAAGRRR